MAPTQRTNPNLTRFFTTQPLPVLTSLLSRALQSLNLSGPSSASKTFEFLYPSSTSSPSPEEIASASLGTLFCPSAHG
ncbi:Chk1 protein kinase [Rhodotorula toruloides]